MANPRRCDALRREARFWTKVRMTPGCWEWMGGKTRAGYGGFFIGGKDGYAHRFSWELHKGAIPVGMCVLHRCDNRMCVNPAHLFLGTRTENTRDMMEKERQARGERHGMSRLSTKDVLEIKAQLERGGTHESIALLHGVCRQNITSINSGRLWGHVVGAA
jgi:hypothetical protein